MSEGRGVHRVVRALGNMCGRIGAICNARGMAAVRFLVNALIMICEIAAVAGVAWLGLHHPLIFAGVTAGLAFLQGMFLEHARLKHELPFYFGPRGPRAGLLVPFVATTSSLVRAAVGGIVALLTFSGTDPDRLFWIAVVFGVTLYLATMILRGLAHRLDAKPARWGYFRLAAILGLIYSTGLWLLSSFGKVRTPDLAEMGRTLIFDTPVKPSVEQGSELLFRMKLYIDSVIVALLKPIVGTDWAPIVGIAISVNVLTGFVVGIFAVLIAEMVVRSETALL